MRRDTHHNIVLLLWSNIPRRLASVPPACIKQTVAWHHWGVFFSSTRRGSVCRPRWRDRRAPTEAHQRRPPTAAKGNWLGLHRDAAAEGNFADSWVHKDLDTVRNSLMQAHFQVRLKRNPCIWKELGKKLKNANLFPFSHEVFCF